MICNRIFAPVFLIAVSAAPLGAEPVREGVLGRRDGLNDRGEPLTNMEAVERARDRGAGRIVDEDTWTLDRIDAYQNRRYVPGREAQLFDQERDRQLRVEQRDRRARDATREEQADLGIVPGDLAPRDGASPMSMQLHQDERTLEAADEELARMVRQLDDAEARELTSLRGRLDRERRAGEWDARSERIKKDYATWRAQAQAERDRVSSRVIGPKPKTATTRPAAAEENTGARKPAEPEGKVREEGD